MGRGLTGLVLLSALTSVAVAPVSSASVPPAARAAVAPTPEPANDNLAAARTISSFPSSIAGTTVGATLEPGEVSSSCASVSTVNSVWYTLRSASAQRIAVNLAAEGRLDGVVDVYHATRSQLQPAACEQTDAQGKAAVSFKASKNGVYLIRIAALANSQLAGFTLEVFLPTPPVGPPGPQLPRGGVSGQVDPVQNVNAAYSLNLRSGVSYLINLANETKGACVHGALFAPGTASFEEGSPLLHVSCGGYRLFTPGPGQGGRYSFEVTPSSHRGVQRFHIQSAVAGRLETAPGQALGNYASARAALNGRGIAVLRLYRLDITSHSNLTLRLSAPETADFNLQLRNQNGDVVECQCGGSGSQTLQRQLVPGRYYAVVSVRDATGGSFTLVRESRTITSTSISFSPAKAVSGQGTTIGVKVSPASSGPVTVDVEAFDPVFGWQFNRRLSAFVGAGSASIAFAPPWQGRWRARADFAGSHGTSASASGFSYLLVH